jgi:hypothetical protein
VLAGRNGTAIARVQAHIDRRRAHGHVSEGRQRRASIFALLLTPTMLLDEEETLGRYLPGPELPLFPIAELGIWKTLLLRMKLDVNLSLRVHDTTTRCYPFAAPLLVSTPSRSPRVAARYLLVLIVTCIKLDQYYMLQKVVWARWPLEPTLPRSTEHVSSTPIEKPYRIGMP